jgi:hypothetical protein
VTRLIVAQSMVAGEPQQGIAAPIGR